MTLQPVAKDWQPGFRPGRIVDLVYVHQAPSRSERVTLYAPTARELVDEILRVTAYSAHRLAAFEPYARHPVIEIREDVPVGKGITVCIITDGPPIGELVRELAAARRGEL